VDTQGDAFFFVFAKARDAVGAAADSQQALAAHAWPGDTSLA
jgi:class 3 adenylate cyclase